MGPGFKFKAVSQEEKQARFQNYMNGINAQAITKTREDENFFRQRLEMPLLPANYPVAGEVTPEHQTPCRVVNRPSGFVSSYLIHPLGDKCIVTYCT